MKKSVPLDQTVCLNYCPYYKPGNKEELSCRGYDTVGRLVLAGTIADVQPSGGKADRTTVEALVQKMCIVCDFHEKDCDFMTDRTAPSCGGFSLLAQLLALGTLKMEDIE